EYAAGLEIDEVYRHRVTLVAQNDRIEQRMNAFECRSAAEDFEEFDGFEMGKGGDETAESQDVIEVAMSEQYTVELLIADAAAQDLALRAFATVNQITVFARKNGDRREATMHRRRR